MDIPSHIATVYKTSSCLYTTTEIQQALDRMAHEIKEVLEDKNPIILCVMIGGLVPLGNLLPRLDFPLELDYIHATRYRGEITGGSLNWIMKPKTKLAGRTILVVDDILDGGVTLQAILDYCATENAKAIYSAVLVDKKHKRVVGGLAKADFTGLEVNDHYIFGYGMDYKNYLRNAPGIYVVAPEYE